MCVLLLKEYSNRSSAVSACGIFVLLYTVIYMLTKRWNRVGGWFVDGGADCRGAIEASGEPMVPQALIPNNPQANATDVWKINIQKREMQKSYMDYWNSTAKLTGTGRPIDAIIAPLAPFPAARENQYTYYNYSIWVNGLDYTSVVIPVTSVDKNVDKKDGNFKAKDETDQKTQDTCQWFTPNYFAALLTVVRRPRALSWRPCQYPARWTEATGGEDGCAS